MKVYTIGREAGCNVIINDSTNVVSRRHAVLQVNSYGKMTITDMSSNGTYVNGMRITKNTPFPVSRKDTVSFAHAATLDWNSIPLTFTLTHYAAAVAAALFVIVGLYFLFTHNPFKTNDGYGEDSDKQEVVEGSESGDENANEATQQGDDATDTQQIEQKRNELNTKLSEARGVKTAISNECAANALELAIKQAEEVYNNTAATLQEVTNALDALTKAVTAAIEAQRKDGYKATKTAPASNGPTSKRKEEEKPKNPTQDKSQEKPAESKETGTQKENTAPKDNAQKEVPKAETTRGDR